MAKITSIKLKQRKWSEDDWTYVEPVLRVLRDDESKTDYIFRYAQKDELLTLEDGLFVMIEQHFVWSGVREKTVVERYVINVQAGGQPPLTLQSFRLIPMSRGERPKPSPWMWNEGELDSKFAREKLAPQPFPPYRRWRKGPEKNSVVLTAEDDDDSMESSYRA